MKPEVYPALRVGEVERADEMLVNYYESCLDETRDTIAAAFPHRAKILTKALDAHAGGDYELSIPVLLAQADGIAKESIGIGLYKKIDRKEERGVPATRSSTGLRWTRPSR